LVISEVFPDISSTGANARDNKISSAVVAYSSLGDAMARMKYTKDSSSVVHTVKKDKK